MMIERFSRPLIPVLLSSLGALGLGACSHDRSRDVRYAEANLTSERQEAANDETRLAQKQSVEQAETHNKPMTDDERAQLEHKQIDERAEVRADGQRDIADADKQVANELTALEGDRTTTTVDAKERVAKADATVQEAKNKSARLAAKKKPKFSADYNTYTTKKADVVNKIDNLGTATNANFTEAKAKLQKSLDELDAAVRKIEGDI